MPKLQTLPLRPKRRYVKYIDHIGSDIYIVICGGLAHSEVWKINHTTDTYEIKIDAASIKIAIEYIEELKEQYIDQQEDYQPPCPECGTPMPLRYGKFGPFYGCPRWPNCKGTLSPTSPEVCKTWIGKVPKPPEEPEDSRLSELFDD